MRWHGGRATRVLQVGVEEAGATRAPQHGPAAMEIPIRPVIPAREAIMAATVPALEAGQALTGAPAAITMAGLVTPGAMAEDFTPDMSPRLMARRIVQDSIAVGKLLACLQSGDRRGVGKFNSA